MFRAIDASTGEPFGESLSIHSHVDVEAACEAAYAAFPVFSMTSAAERAALLERIGDEIVALGDALLDLASRESGLPLTRLHGERGRTVSQLQLFANVLRDGDWLGLRIDSADPARTPPRPDLRLLKVALGPVAVFGASNFPLAFSTAGGDTASALAAGCPVVVKAHPAHKATSLMVAGAVARAVAASGLPSGVFGPAALVIRCATPDDIATALSALEGQLTASLHLTDADLPLARTLMPIVSQMAGRIIVNNWPTGVEVGHAMVHGGPFPATSDARTTSVGSLAIERFLRPLSYQNVPVELLPDPLRDPVAQGLPVRLDGTLISAR